MSTHCPTCGKCLCCGRPLVEVQPAWPRVAPWEPFYPWSVWRTTTTTVPSDGLSSVTVTNVPEVTT